MDRRARSTTVAAAALCVLVVAFGAWLARPDDAGPIGAAPGDRASDADASAPRMTLVAPAADARRGDGAPPPTPAPTADAVRPLALPAAEPAWDGVLDEPVERLVVALDVGCPVVNAPWMALQPVGGGKPIHDDLSPVDKDICFIGGLRIPTNAEREPSCAFVEWPQVPELHMPEGEYDVTMVAPGWRADPLRVVLRDGEPSRTVRLRAEALTRVSGSVACVPAAPPPDAIVVSLACAGESETRDVRTSLDASGAFCLVGWHVDDDVRALRVTVSAAGRSPASSDWIGIDDPHAFALDDLAFELVGAAVVAGRVFDADSGEPLAATISLDPARAAWEPPDDLEPSPGETTTDADGRYLIDTRAPATLRLRVASEAGGWTSEAQRVEPGQRLVQDVPLAGPATLVARVVVRTAALGESPLRVRVVPTHDPDAPSRGDDGSVPVGADGTAVLGDLSAGRFLVQALLEVDPRMRLAVAAREVELASGGTSEVELVVGGMRVAGSLVGADDLELPILALAGPSLAPAALPTRADASGAFALEVGGPGDFVGLALGGDTQGDVQRIVVAGAPFTVRPDGGLAAPLRVDVQATRLELVHPKRDEPSWLSGLRKRVVRVTLEPDDARLVPLGRFTRELPLPPGRTLTVLGLPAGRCRVSWVSAVPAPVPDARELRLHEGVPERVVLDDD